MAQMSRREIEIMLGLGEYSLEPVERGSDLDVGPVVELVVVSLQQILFVITNFRFALREHECWYVDQCVSQCSEDTPEMIDKAHQANCMTMSEALDFLNDIEGVIPMNPRVLATLAVLGIACLIDQGEKEETLSFVGFHRSSMESLRVIRQSVVRNRENMHDVSLDEAIGDVDAEWEYQIPIQMLKDYDLLETVGDESTTVRSCRLIQQLIRVYDDITKKAA